MERDTETERVFINKIEATEYFCSFSNFKPFQIGFPEYVEAFKTAQVDGDLLLILTNEDLCDGLGMTSSIVRKR